MESHVQTPLNLLYLKSSDRAPVTERRGRIVPLKLACFQALAAEPDIYDKLVASLAPSIYQMEDVKKGILCQLFGGASKANLPGPLLS